MTMATVEEECWHGKLSSKEAEERLVDVMSTRPTPTSSEKVR